MKLTTVRFFDHLDQFKEFYGCVLPKPHPWRLLDRPMVGQINGIPALRGVAQATNGILVAVTQNDKSMFVGHLDSFTCDEQEHVVFFGAPAKEAKTKTKKPRQPEVDISEFM